MPVTPLPIANGAYQSDSLPISAQECLNFYPNLPQAPALSQETLFGTPGITQLTTTGAIKQVNRGAHVMASIAYFVNGTLLYRLNQLIDSEGVESFTTDSLGTVPGTGRVSLADNGTQLMILVPGGNGFIFVEPGTFTQIIDADFTANGNPQLVVFNDGFFVVTTDTKKFIVSNLNDGLNWDALDRGTAEADPDIIVAPITFKNQLLIGGSETTEGFDNILGTADFPYQRTGLFIDKGVFAKFSIIASNNTFMFIGGGTNESPAVWAFVGNTVEKVSTTAIDSILQDLTSAQLDEVFAWSYAQKGAYFVGFTLPDTTIVFDTISKRWHERKSFIDDDLIRFRVNSLITAYGRVLVGDSIDGRIGHLDPDTFTEYGEVIFGRVATQPFQNNMQSFTVPSLELTVESGVGNKDAPDPKVRFERSVNGGNVFRDSRTRPMGKVGEYERRAIWNRNGRTSRFDVYRFTMTGAFKRVIIQLTADIRGGAK